MELIFEILKFCDFVYRGHLWHLDGLASGATRIIRVVDSSTMCVIMIQQVCFCVTQLWFIMPLGDADTQDNRDSRSRSPVRDRDRSLSPARPLALVVEPPIPAPPIIIHAPAPPPYVDPPPLAPPLPPVPGPLEGPALLPGPTDPDHTGFLAVIRMWTNKYRITHDALESLGHILQSTSDSIPKMTPYLLESRLHLSDSRFTKYVMCQRCSSIYTLSDCIRKTALPNGAIREEALSCSYVAYPFHPQAARRQVCGHQLLKSVGGKWVPVVEFFSVPLVGRLTELLSRCVYVQVHVCVIMCSCPIMWRIILQ